MPQWTVDGADKATGKDKTLLVEAPNADAARLVASKQGLAVAEVAPSEQHATIEAAQLSYRSIPMARPAPATRQVIWTVRVLMWIALGAYVVAVAEVATSMTLMTSKMQTPVGIATIVLSAVFGALKTAGFGAVFQLGATLLQLLADHLAIRRP